MQALMKTEILLPKFLQNIAAHSRTQHSLIHDASNEQREKYLNSTISLPTYKVEKSDYKEMKGKIPVVDEYLKITSPNYASVSGKRLFVQPDLFNKASKLTSGAERKFDIKLKYSYLDIDSIDIKIPANYKVESMPKDLSIKINSASIKYLISLMEAPFIWFEYMKRIPPVFLQANLITWLVFAIPCIKPIVLKLFSLNKQNKF